MTLKEIEKQAIIKMLLDVRCNVLKAAKMLGISRSTLYRKMDEHNIPRRFKEENLLPRGA